METAESSKTRALARRAAEAAGLPDVLSAEEIGRYADFAAFFLREFKKGMQMHAALCKEPAGRSAGEGPHYAVSQRIFGDVSLTAGIYGTTDVFARMASAYSEMEIKKGDILAIDALMEFLNVITGLYIIKCAEDGLRLDLGLPRSGRCVKTSKYLLRLPIQSDAGSFELLLSKYELV